MAKSNKAVAASTKVTLTALAMEIFRGVYEGTRDNPEMSARQEILHKFENELGMDNANKRQTYYNNCMNKVRQEQQDAALERAEKGKRVWSAFKVGVGNTVTSVGSFTSAKAAKEFNTLYDHHGVYPGLLDKGDVVEDKYLNRDKRTSAKKAA